MYALGLLNKFEVIKPGSEARAEAVFDKNSPVFNGHFPDNPILPGVLQMALVMETAQKLLCTQLEITEVKQSKFRTPVTPGDRVEITVEASVAEEGVYILRAGLHKMDKNEQDAGPSSFRMTVVEIKNP